MFTQTWTVLNMLLILGAVSVGAFVLGVYLRRK